jgi:hypothetical protein
MRITLLCLLADFSVGDSNYGASHILSDFESALSAFEDENPVSCIRTSNELAVSGEDFIEAFKQLDLDRRSRIFSDSFASKIVQVLEGLAVCVRKAQRLQSRRRS